MILTFRLVAALGLCACSDDRPSAARSEEHVVKAPPRPPPSGAMQDVPLPGSEPMPSRPEAPRMPDPPADDEYLTKQADYLSAAKPEEECLASGLDEASCDTERAKLKLDILDE